MSSLSKPAVWQMATIQSTDAATVKSLRRVLKKRGMRHTEILKGDKSTAFEIYYQEPIEMFYLGLCVNFQHSITMLESINKTLITIG